MKDYLPLIEAALDRYSAAFDLPELFAASMRYSLLSGGKRIRPLICLASAVAVGGDARDARYPAAARRISHIRPRGAEAPRHRAGPHAPNPNAADPA